MLFKQNIDTSLCIGKTCLNCRELYTKVTNPKGHGKKGTIVAIILGTKSEDVIKVLEKIRISKRKLIQEFTLDLSTTMMRIVRSSFPNVTMTNDRFHVQFFLHEAIDKLRVSFRLMARDLENDEIQRCNEHSKE